MNSRAAEGNPLNNSPGANGAPRLGASPCERRGVVSRRIENSGGNFWRRKNSEKHRVPVKIHNIDISTVKPHCERRHIVTDYMLFRIPGLKKCILWGRPQVS